MKTAKTVNIAIQIMGRVIGIVASQMNSGKQKMFRVEREVIMTENQAIKIIKQEKQWESNARICDAFDVAIQALEKQAPRKLYGNEWNPVHTGDTVSGLCPVCMTEFVCITPRMYKANNYGYCKACGQKLDWGE